MNRKKIEEIVRKASNVSSKRDFAREVAERVENWTDIHEIISVVKEMEDNGAELPEIHNKLRRHFLYLKRSEDEDFILAEDGDKELIASKGVFDSPQRKNDSQEENEKQSKETTKVIHSEEESHSETSLEALIPKAKPYIQRNLCNGDKDINTFQDVYNKRPEGHPQNVLLVGPTGSGKTHAIKKVAEELQKPMIRVNLNRMTTVEDFVGQWTPANNSGFKWQDGVLPRLMKSGGILVLDEINAAPPEILFVLHSALDFREITITQKNGEYIQAHPDFWVIACMNPDYTGTQRLNEALKDRFELVFNYRYERKIEKKLVSNSKLLDVAKKLRKMYESPTQEIRTPVSTRMLKQFERNEKHYGYKIAVESFVNKFEQEEKSAVREAVSLTLDNE